VRERRRKEDDGSEINKTAAEEIAKQICV
jgi:hypothetical protein